MRGTTLLSPYDEKKKTAFDVGYPKKKEGFYEKRQRVLSIRRVNSSQRFPVALGRRQKP